MLEQTKTAVRRYVEELIEEADARGRELWPGCERAITKRQEMAYRLCHHHHFGLRTNIAAEVMGISRSALWELLWRVGKIAPQLFPILPPRMARIYDRFVHERETIAEIAYGLGVSRRYVYRVLRKMYHDRERTGLYFPHNSSRRIVYSSWMDPYIRETF